MKIAFISQYYPPFIEGGSGVYAKNFVEKLSRRDIEIHLFTVKASRPKQPNVIVQDVPFINIKFFSILTYFNNLKKIYKKIEDEIGSFDIVHETDVFGYPLKKIKEKTPRVVTIFHINKIEADKATGLSRIKNIRDGIGYGLKWERAVIERADKIIAISEFTKNEIIKTYNIDDEKIEVIYLGGYDKIKKFTPSELEQFKSELIINKDYSIILFVGNPIERKNIDVLIKAFEEVECKKSILIITGYGDFSKYCNLVEKLDMQKRVIFTGEVSNIDLQKLYNICDLFVLPSKLEGFGIVLVEAMAAGKPIVATNVGGISEVVEDKRNGILVEPNNVKELTQARQYFLENPAIARKIGSYNKEYGKEKFSWEKNAEETEKIYRSLL